jgi:hypothetical protein
MQNIMLHRLKEEEFLHKLSLVLSLPITRPLFLGNPLKNYAFNWTIYSYLDEIV